MKKKGFKRPFAFLLALVLALGTIQPGTLHAAESKPKQAAWVSGVEIPINQQNFPDTSFRTYIQNTFDSDNNGSLSDSECKAVKEIILPGDDKSSFSSVVGISYFPNLETLDCSGSWITSLDVSSNTALKTLNCSHTRVAKLDVSSNSALETLKFRGAPITNLNIGAKGNNFSLDTLSTSASVVLLRSDKTFNLAQRFGADLSKVESVTGATYDPKTGTVSDFTPMNDVVYMYNAGTVGNVKQLLQVSLYLTLPPYIKEYTVEFYANLPGNNELLGSEHFESDYVQQLYCNNIPTPEGRKFVCWNTRADGSGASYKNGQEVVNLTGIPNYVLKMYAQWSTGGGQDPIDPDPIDPDNNTTYTIRFDGNGATDGAMDDLTNLVSGIYYKLPGNTYERTDYSFNGWNTEKDGSGTLYSDFDSVFHIVTAPNEVFTLYAQWMPVLRSYTIRFDGNGADASSPGMNDITMYYGFEAFLTTNTFTKKDHEFLYWNTEPDGSGWKYLDGAKVRNMTEVNGGIVTLYAQWKNIVEKPKTYTILFDENGVDMGYLKKMECEYGQTYTLPLNMYSAPDCFFLGWNTKQDGFGTSINDGGKVTNLTDVDGGTVTLYAQWWKDDNPNVTQNYTIRFDGNGATKGSIANMTCEFDKDYTLPANKFERTDYEFSGWNTKANGSGTSYSDKASVRNLTSTNGATVVLYAQWTKIVPKTYTLQFNGNGSTKGSIAGMTCDFDKDYTLPTNTFEKTGYDFSGWNTKADGSGTSFKQGAIVRNLANTDGATVTLYAQWTKATPKTYTIQYNGNGADSGSMSEMTCTIGTSCLLSKNTFARKEYTFAGWNTKADGSGTSYTDGQTVLDLTKNAGEVVVLYAQWTHLNTYTIQFNGNGSTKGQMENLTNCCSGLSYNLPQNQFEKEDHIFKGWNTKADGSGTPYTETITYTALTANETLTLYAQWTKKTYIIAFDGNGADSGSLNKMDCLIDKEYSLPLNMFEKTGYEFNGWNTKQDGSGTSYADGAMVQRLTDINGDTVTLYAQWTKTAQKVFTIRFDGNGASSGSLDPMECTFGVSYPLSENVFTRYNYTFAGWNTAADGSGATYQDGAIVNDQILSAAEGGTIVLYALWAPVMVVKTYTIAFNGNGAENASAMANMTKCLVDKDYILSVNKYIRNGYIFSGWNTAADGSGTAYPDGAKVRNLTDADGATVTLYAQWTEIIPEPKTYTIRFNGNGAENASAMADIADCLFDTEYTLTTNLYTRNGYTFNGWNTKANGSGTAYPDGAAVKNLTNVDGAMVILYAQWTEIIPEVKTYLVQFNGNGADSGSMDALSCELNKAVTLPGNVFGKTDYIFVEWNTEADGSGTSYKDGSVVTNLSNEADSTVTLYAQWAEKADKQTYTIQFDGNGATSGTMSGIVCVIGYYCALPKNTFVRENYVFASWNTEKNGSGINYADGTGVSDLSQMNGDTVTLYAQWTYLNPYSIHFDGNGSTKGQMSDMTNLISGTTYELSENQYERDGYDFSGWNTAADGSGTPYWDGGKITYSPTTENETLTLYAQWVKKEEVTKTYTITFNGNGATSGTMADITNCQFGKSYTLPENTFASATHTFIGWNTAADGSGTAYPDGAIVTNLTQIKGGVVTLYAQWEAISLTYTIYLDGNGNDSGASTRMECTFGISYSLPNNPFGKTGYTFTGWNTKADGSGTSYKAGAIVTDLAATGGDLVTLYAQWTPQAAAKTYTIIFNGNGADASSPAMNQMTGCLFDTNYVLTKNTYTRNGYTFNSWNTKPDGSGTSYKDGITVRNLANTNETQVTLYAQWTKKETGPSTYLIQFDGNSASGSMASCKYLLDREYVLPSNAFTFVNKSFNGWNTKADGSGTSYENGASVKNLAASGATVTLYAQWKDSAYTIRFDGNGASSGTMTDMTNCYYGPSYILPENTFVKTSYEFTGWNTKANGSGTAYADAASFNLTSGEDGAIVTLYAQWAKEPDKTYTIVFDKNGADSGLMAKIADCLYGQGYTLPKNKFVKSSYNFAGWNTKADGSGDTYAEASAFYLASGADGATVTLYAQWVKAADPEKTYTIKFDGNGADSGSMADITDCVYGQGYFLPENKFVKASCQFAGWNTQADGKGTPYADASSVNLTSEADGTVLTLYAQWKTAEVSEEQTYDIEFNGNGAPGAMATLTILRDIAFQLPANSFVFTGKVFAGWNTKPDGSGTSYNDRASVLNLAAANETIVLYAQWISNSSSYTVHFDGNGADSGAMADITGCLYGQQYTMPKNKFVRNGYTFTGWNTKPDGSGTAYSAESPIIRTSANGGSTMILYAQWKKAESGQTYTIKFNGNKNTGGTMKDITNCQYNTTYTLPKNTFLRTGYSFAGWNTQADGKGTSYSDGASIKRASAAGNITLYAQWTANKYTVKFNGNKSTSGKMAAMTLTYGKSATLKANVFKRKGYSFTGWNRQADGKGKSYKNKASVKNLSTKSGGSITLYAQWKKTTYKITYKLNGGKNNSKNPSSYTITSSAIKLAKPTKTGYTFGGWYKDSKFKIKVTKIKKGSTGNITLYAKWTANKYTIQFKGNGATSGKMSAMTNRSYGRSYKLTANKFKKKGYKFVGWNTQANGKGKSYKNKANVKNLSTKSGGKVTLYAQWKKQK